MFTIFIIVSLLLAFSFVGLAIGVLVKGKFPETHVGRNAEMKKLGITCAKNDNKPDVSHNKTITTKGQDSRAAGYLLFSKSNAASNAMFEGLKSTPFTYSHDSAAPCSRSIPLSSHSTESGPK